MEQTRKERIEHFAGDIFLSDGKKRVLEMLEHPERFNANGDRLESKKEIKTICNEVDAELSIDESTLYIKGERKAVRD